MFCGGHFEYLIGAGCAGAWSGIEITEVWDGRENSQILGGSRSLTEGNNFLRAPSRLRAIATKHKTRAIKVGSFFIHVLNGCEGSLWFELTYASFVIS